MRDGCVEDRESYSGLGWEGHENNQGKLSQEKASKW